MHARRTPRAFALAVLLSASTASLAADSPTPLGSPGAVTIEPTEAKLVGRRATRQLLATGNYPDGSVRDVTRALEWVSLNPEVAAVSPKGRVTPRGNGTATLVARGGSSEAKTTVTVEGMERPAPVSFRNDVIPAFSQASCNMGACHGTPTGKGGIQAQPPRLSPRPGLHHPHPRGHRPTDHPDRSRREHDPPQAARRSPPRRGLAARPRLEIVRISPRLGRRGGQGRSRRPRRRLARNSARIAGLERPREVATGRRGRQIRRRLQPRRDPDLLLRLVEPRDRRGGRRRPRRLQEPGRSRDHRPLSEPRRQRPAHAPGRSPRLPRGRRSPGKRHRQGRLQQAQPDADRPLRDMHRRRIHPPGLARRARHLAPTRRRSRNSSPTPIPRGGPR